MSKDIPFSMKGLVYEKGVPPKKFHFTHFWKMGRGDIAANI